jgi:hypothetical protein
MDAFPREVLERVFFFSVDVGDPCKPGFKSGRSVIGKHNAPILLTRVCQSWRQITISTPQLWTRLDLRTAVSANYEQPSVFRAPGDADRTFDSFFYITERPDIYTRSEGAVLRKTSVRMANSLSSIVELFVRRAGALPMELHASNICDLWYSKVIRKFSRFLRRNLDRFWLISLEDCPELARELFPRRCTTSAALLAELNIIKHKAWNSSGAVLNASSLRRVVIPAVTSSQQLLSCCWLNLTYACILWTEEQPTMLSLCSNLVTCKLAIGSGVSACTLTPFVLHRLLSLEVEATDRFDMPSILSALRAPNLQHLSLVCVGNDWPRSLRWAPILSADDSFSAIQQLRLDLDLLNDIAVIICAMTELAHLELGQHCRHSSIVLRALCPKESTHRSTARSTLACPNLTKLAMHGCQVARHDLADFVEGRTKHLREAGGTFSLVLDACPGVTPVHVAAIKKLMPPVSVTYINIDITA